MKKLIFLLLTIIGMGTARAQLLVIFQTPPSGLTYKPQLWTMVLTNTGTAPMDMHIEVTLNTIGSAQHLLSGITRTFTLPVGTTIINASQLMPIQYNVSTVTYNLDANPFGLLPIGEFEACYQFFKHSFDGFYQVAEECREIQVEPLAPPHLIYPFDQTAVEETHPQFNWLPPLPMQLFSNLHYDLTLVEIIANQSAADALQQNPPLYQGSNLISNSLLYPLSAPELQYDKKYAWKVTAKSGDAFVGRSEEWQFELKQFSKYSNTATIPQPFIQLKKDPETAYAIFIDELKFSYTNETSDSTWNIKITDLSDPQKAVRYLQQDSIALMPGQNLVRYQAAQDNYFINKHLYRIEINNSRREMWRLCFEFRKTETPDN